MTRLLFRSEKNGYHILKVRWKNKEGICKGVGVRFIEGVSYEFDGMQKYDPVRQEKFVEFSKAVELLDSTEIGLTAYLATECPTVAESSARALVNKYGKSVLDAIKDPHRIAHEMNGFPIERATKIADWARGESSNAQIKQELYAIGLVPSLVARLLKEYGPNAREKIKDNCFNLIELDGFGFATVAKIADLVGIRHDNPGRIRCGIMHVMSEKCGEGGHTCVPKSVIINDSCRLLQLTRNFVEEQLDRLLEFGKLVDTSKFNYDTSKIDDVDHIEEAFSEMETIE